MPEATHLPSLEQLQSTLVRGDGRQGQKGDMRGESEDKNRDLILRAILFEHQRGDEPLNVEGSSEY